MMLPCLLLSFLYNDIMWLVEFLSVIQRGTSLHRIDWSDSCFLSTFQLYIPTLIVLFVAGDRCRSVRRYVYCCRPRLRSMLKLRATPAPITRMLITEILKMDQRFASLIHILSHHFVLLYQWYCFTNQGDQMKMLPFPMRPKENVAFSYETKRKCCLFLMQDGPDHSACHYQIIQQMLTIS